MSEVRRVTTDKWEEMFELTAYAFNTDHSDKRKERFRTLIDHSWNYGFFNEEHQLVSQVIATPFAINFYGQRYQMAGIGSVASYPEARGQGAINRIMAQLLRDCREKGIALSYLAPFSYPFYRRYGYETLFEKVSYEFRTSDWPVLSGKASGTIRRLPLSEAMGSIQTVYSKETKNHHGGLAREEWWQKYKFTKRDNLLYAIYQEEHQEPAGYLVYQMVADSFQILEWGALTYNAHQALLQFVGSHASSFQTIQYSRGYTGQLLTDFFDAPLAKVEIQPDMMGRIVDIEKFLVTYPFFQIDETIKISFEVLSDPYGKWNEGIYEVTIGKEERQVLRVEETETLKLSGDIQAMTQLFLGRHELSELLFQKKVTTEGSMVDAEQLSNLFPKQRPLLEDYF